MTKIPTFIILFHKSYCSYGDPHPQCNHCVSVRELADKPRCLVLDPWQPCCWLSLHMHAAGGAERSQHFFSHKEAAASRQWFSLSQKPRNELIEQMERKWQRRTSSLLSRHPQLEEILFNKPDDQFFFSPINTTARWCSVVQNKQNKKNQTPSWFVFF